MSERTRLREDAIRNDRRLILSAVYTRYPCSMGEGELVDGLEKAIPEDLIKRDIEAIVQHGLMSRTWEQATPFSPQEWRLKLTARGEYFCRCNYPWHEIERL